MLLLLPGRLPLLVPRTLIACCCRCCRCCCPCCCCWLSGDDWVDWVGLSVYHFGASYPWGANKVPEAYKFYNKVCYVTVISNSHVTENMPSKCWTL
jgi:hypothetical protein